jgi:hypothetical protein
MVHRRADFGVQISVEREVGILKDEITNIPGLLVN